MTKKAILLIISLIVWNLCHAQQTVTLSGKVVSSQDKSPLPYAFVKLKNVALSTVTNATGNFTIHVPIAHQNGMLQFSYLGYLPKELNISTIKNKRSFTISLQESATRLEEVVIENEKGISAKQVLKKVLKRIPDNYSQDSFLLKGYYRETLKENGSYIKYADAACEFFLAPYSGDLTHYKELDTYNPAKASVASMGSFSLYWGDRLHRGHFAGYTLKGEQVKIEEARASSNLSRTNLMANIEGGPLGILGKDRMKYLRYFMDKRAQKKYNFSLREIPDEQGNWQYVISFEPKVDQETVEEIHQIKKENKRWRAFYRHVDRPLAGKIYVDAKSFAVTAMEYRIPDFLKAHFCGFTTMAIKHFDYSIKISYTQKEGKWYPESIRQEDEFIIVDTVTNTTTPYAAITELSVLAINPKATESFPLAQIFPNYDRNSLYDYPLSYNAEFWENYQKEYSVSSIDAEIYKEMSIKQDLMKQFHRKHERDTTLAAPIAQKSDSTIEIHGTTLVDHYAWMKDTKHPKNNTKVMGYLNAENEYTENYFVPLRKAQRDIFQEMAVHVPRNTKSLPEYKRGYWYYHEYKDGQDYRVFYRKKEGENAQEEILLDENELAKKHAYFSIDRYSISPNNEIMAYWENTMGNDTPTLVFKQLKTGKLLTDTLERAATIAWLKDGSGFYYAWQAPKNNRVSKIYRHRFGTKQENDKLVYEEKNPLFSAWIEDTDDFQYTLLQTGSFTTTEVRYKLNDSSHDDFQVVHPQQEGHKYYAFYYKKRFYIATNQEAQNFRVMEAPAANPSKENWKEVVPHNKKAVLTSFKRFENHIALTERSNAVDRVRIIDVRTNKAHYIKMKEDIASVRVGANPKSNTNIVRISYSSFNIPTQIYDYNMETREKTLVREDTMRDLGYMKAMEHTKVKRVWAKTEDGTKIPITLIYKDFQTNRKINKHVYLTGYGAYGIGRTPTFSREILPLLDRGIVYAVAHIRGGNEMGEAWHDEGKMLNKKNSFTDFIACAEELVEEGYAEKGKIIAQGGSAGGLLMGAITNMRPDLFQTVILDVPFVDMLNTGMDPKLPATTGEYVEFGNVNVKEEFTYMLSYSPYENVKKQDYPNMLFFTGLNDSRVGYWEPAKMVAKLRQYNTSDQLILLKTDFNVGHGGGSGRYARYREMAYKYALIFELMRLAAIEEEGTDKKN